MTVLRILRVKVRDGHDGAKKGRWLDRGQGPNQGKKEQKGPRGTRGTREQKRKTNHTTRLGGGQFPDADGNDQVFLDSTNDIMIPQYEEYINANNMIDMGDMDEMDDTDDQKVLPGPEPSEDEMFDLSESEDKSSESSGSNASQPDDERDNINDISENINANENINDNENSSYESSSSSSEQKKSSHPTYCGASRWVPFTKKTSGSKLGQGSFGTVTQVCKKEESNKKSECNYALKTLRDPDQTAESMVYSLIHQKQLDVGQDAIAPHFYDSGQPRTGVCSNEPLSGFIVTEKMQAKLFDVLQKIATHRSITRNQKTELTSLLAERGMILLDRLHDEVGMCHNDPNMGNFMMTFVNPKMSVETIHTSSAATLLHEFQECKMVMIDFGLSRPIAYDIVTPNDNTIPELDYFMYFYFLLVSSFGDMLDPDFQYRLASRIPRRMGPDGKYTEDFMLIKMRERMNTQVKGSMEYSATARQAYDQINQIVENVHVSPDSMLGIVSARWMQEYDEPKKSSSDFQEQYLNQSRPWQNFSKKEVKKYLFARKKKRAEQSKRKPKNKPKKKSQSKKLRGGTHESEKVLAKFQIQIVPGRCIAQPLKFTDPKRQLTKSIPDSKSKNEFIQKVTRFLEKKVFIDGKNQSEKLEFSYIVQQKGSNIWVELFMDVDQPNINKGTKEKLIHVMNSYVADPENREKWRNDPEFQILQNILQDALHFECSKVEIK